MFAAGPLQLPGSRIWCWGVSITLGVCRSHMDTQHRQHQQHDPSTKKLFRVHRTKGKKQVARLGRVLHLVRRTTTTPMLALPPCGGRDPYGRPNPAPGQAGGDKPHPLQSVAASWGRSVHPIVVRVEFLTNSVPHARHMHFEMLVEIVSVETSQCVRLVEIILTLPKSKFPNVSR